MAANLFGQRVTSLRYRRVNTYTHVCTHAQYTYDTKYEDTRLDIIIIVVVYTYIEYYIILFADVSLDFRNGKKNNNTIKIIKKKKKYAAIVVLCR